jgi:RNA polymerase sigma factor FliA
VERFEPEREIRFETFAAPRVKGAIIDELRSLDWVPRSVRARAREIANVNARLEHQLLRAPTDQEMADALETSVEEFQTTLTRISNASVVALDELWTLSDASGTWSRCSARSRTRERRTRPRRWTAPRRRIGSRTPLDGCPSARSS